MNLVLLAAGYKDDSFEGFHRACLFQCIEEVSEHVPVSFRVSLFAVLVDPSYEEDIPRKHSAGLWPCDRLMRGYQCGIERAQLVML